MSRAPRKPMPPSLSEKDLATMKETASQGGLGAASKDESEAQHIAPAKPEPAKEKQADKIMPEKGIRPYVAPTAELAKAVQEAMNALSPDAQRFVQPAAILREFLQEHDAYLAKMFRDKHDL